MFQPGSGSMALRVSVAEPGVFNTTCCVARRRAHRLHHHKPNVVRPLNALDHKNLNLPKVYAINYIDINIVEVMINDCQCKGEPVVNTVSAIARYLAGVIFLVFGLNGFLHFIRLPPPDGVAGQFMVALFVSHYLTVIFGFQVIAAVLLLANRYVPLALAVLAPVIVNILCFHALMAPSGLPLALMVALLWVLIFLDVRPAFAALFQSRLQRQA
jgi:putative oxidoreductase